MMALQGIIDTEAQRLTTLTSKHPDPFRSRSLESLLTKETQRQAAAAPALDDPVFDLDELEAFANAIIDPDTGESLEYRHLIKNPKTRDTWLRAAANEFGRLMTGLKRGINGTQTMRFIYKHQVPKGRKVTYARFCCDFRPQKDEPNRCRITVGGDRLDYPGEVATKTADMTTIKCLLNSVLSRSKARFMTGDVKNFYLNTPMERPEYMRIPIHLIPDEILQEYDATKYLTDGFIYIEIVKGMYGLAQAGLLANKLLAKRLDPIGYRMTKHTHGLWKHDTKPIQFALVVDDFGIEYQNKADAEELIHALRTHYEAVSVDWEGKLFCGITLEWDYKNRRVDLSMPGYIDKVRHKYHHDMPQQPEHQPHTCATPQYGVKIQMTEDPDSSPPLSPADIKELMGIVGSLLFFGRAIDNTLLMTLSDLASAQSKGTEATQRAAQKLLNYCATHPNPKIRYHASDMALKIHSDASYLSAPKARSRAGGHFFLGNYSTSANPNMHNGALFTIAGLIKHVMSSASEAELAGLFINGKEAAVIRTTLYEMGWKQQEPTPITTDNSTASGIANDTIQQKRSKAMDMRFYWIRDRVKQKQFLVHWAAGSLNLGDYHTKHHPPKHHPMVRPYYIHEPNSPRVIPSDPSVGLRGCVNPDLAKPPGYERTPTNRTQLNQTQQKDPNVSITRLEHPARKTARQCSSPLGPHIARAAAFIGSKAMTYLSLIK
jgi:hypothetical protein